MDKSAAELERTFGIDGSVAIGPGRGGLTCVKLFYEDSYASVRTLLWFVVHYLSLAFLDLLTGEFFLIYVRPEGFGKLGALMQHGFARNSFWEIESTTVDSLDSIPSVTLLLKSNDTTKQIWAHDFELRLTVTLFKQSLNSTSGSLDCELKVSNVGPRPFTFSGALHTYLNVLDARRAKVMLENHKGISKDNITEQVLVRQVKRVQFGEEVDLSIFDVKDEIQLNGLAKDKTTVEKKGFPDVVVWNPHIEKSAGMADLEDSAWRHFVCVEPAIANVLIRLEQHETWVGRMRLS
ncbi:hypothetical protein NDN08_001173 [Rhodosorus marinus]|uniref:Glucose-6-phosphate 1-epimerase n=1 Tax=Rhodosorus marinus TaxID=101924 RepID=A0AAV8UQ07_9RHOD|nr:hypothetical protein NDN08_001173 [Rhodosorus marinus]